MWTPRCALTSVAARPRQSAVAHHERHQPPAPRCTQTHGSAVTTLHRPVWPHVVAPARPPRRAAARSSSSGSSLFSKEQDSRNQGIESGERDGVGSRAVGESHRVSRKRSLRSDKRKAKVAHKLYDTTSVKHRDRLSTKLVYHKAVCTAFRCSEMRCCMYHRRLSRGDSTPRTPAGWREWEAIQRLARGPSVGGTYGRPGGRPPAHLGPSPGPKSSGRRLGASFPVSLRLSNISRALRMAWSMLKYLYEARRPTKAVSLSASASARYFS